MAIKLKLWRYNAIVVDEATLNKEINALKNYKKKCIVAETTSRRIKDELDQIDFLIRCGVKDCDLIDVSPILNRSQT